MATTYSRNRPWGIQYWINGEEQTKIYFASLKERKDRFQVHCKEWSGWNMID